MRLFLTGATGFIGSAIRELALAQGHEVAGLVRPGPERRARSLAVDATRWMPGTLADLPWDAIRSFGPDVCIHTAWIATPGVYLNAPENEQYFHWSMALAKGLAGLALRQLVVLGTCIEYQLGPEPLREDSTPIAPTTPYAQWKDRLRQGLEAELSSDTALAWARVFYPYGVGEHPERLCTSLIRRLQAGEPVTLKTPDSVKDYIYITDLASAFLTLAQCGFAGPVNVATGHGVTVGHIARTLGQLLARPELIQTAQPPAEDPFPVVVGDASRLKSLGWTPQISIAQGLRLLVDERQK